MAGRSGAAALLRRTEANLRSLPRQWVGDSVKTVSRAVSKRLAADTGGDRSLSGAPAKLRVETKVAGQLVVTGTITPGPSRSIGQWTWLEEGTDPHRLGKRGSADRDTSALHPGTEPKRTWSDPVADETRSLIADAQRRFSRVFT